MRERTVTVQTRVRHIAHLTERFAINRDLIAVRRRNAKRMRATVSYGEEAMRRRYTTEMSEGEANGRGNVA